MNPVFVLSALTTLLSGVATTTAVMPVLMDIQAVKDVAIRVVSVTTKLRQRVQQRGGSFSAPSVYEILVSETFELRKPCGDPDRPRSHSRISEKL